MLNLGHGIFLYVPCPYAFYSKSPIRRFLEELRPNAALALELAVLAIGLGLHHILLYHDPKAALAWP